MGPIMVLLGLGSNLGDRLRNLERGIGLLARSLEVRETSSVYETEPWGFRDQPMFLNMACRVETTMPPMELLRFCQDVEREAGREPTFRYGPRVLDVDILAYGNQVIEMPELVIPHPRLAERAFALVPLAEIAGEWVHPSMGKTAAQLLADAGGAEGVLLWGPPLAARSAR